MWDTIKNKLGFNAKTPAPINQSKYTLPTNQQANTSYGSNSSTPISNLQSKASTTSPTLQQMSKDMYTINQPAKKTLNETLTRDWGIAGKAPQFMVNLGKNVQTATGWGMNKLLGEGHYPKGPGATNLWDGMYGPTKAEQEKSEASTRVADAMLKARGVTPGASQTTSETQASSANGGTPTATVNPNQAEIDKIQAQIAELTKQRDAQTTTDAGGSTTEAGTTGEKTEETRAERNKRIDEERKAKRKAEKEAKGATTQDSYWKSMLEQGKEATDGTKTPPAVQDSMNRIRSIQDEIQALENDYSKRTSGLNTQGMSLAAKSGEEKGIQENYQAQKNALVNKMNQENSVLQQQVSMYGTQTGLLQNLLSQTGPQMQFGQLTDPLTGQPMSGGKYGENAQLQNAVQQAYQIYQSNGGDVYDPQIAKLLGTFGMPADSLLTEVARLGAGGQTPNFQGQSSSVGTRNSMIQQLGPQALALDTTLKSVQNLEPMLLDFQKKAGINLTDSTTLNELAQAYQAKWGDQSTQSWQMLVGELQKFTSAIQGAGTGLTPTATSMITEMQNPGSMTVGNLRQYLNQARDVGTNNLNAMQQQIGNVGGTGYFGTPTSPVTTSSYQGNQSTGNPVPLGSVDNPYGQSLMGALPALAGRMASFGAGVAAGAKAFFR